MAKQSSSKIPTILAARLALAALLLLLPGCAPALLPASGQIMLDGQPLDEAAIHFVPLAPKVRMTGARVLQGRFELSAENGLLPGKYRVEIMDLPPISAGHGPNPPARRPFPHRYAHDSRLEIEVPAGPAGPLQFDFELTSKP